jgi:glycosyltransferase involved in cell wall biosynthesis
MKILVAIPAYNEEAKIAETLNSILLNTTDSHDFDVLVVDDGSTDKTFKIASSINDPRIRVIRHLRNLGLGAAFKSAVKSALSTGADIMVTIDADGQFDSSQIKQFISSIENSGSDMVTGSRFLEKSELIDMPIMRNIGNRGYVKAINKIGGISITDASCGFRGYSRKALFHLHLTGRFTYTHETIISLAQQGLEISEIPVRVRYFSERKSSISGSLIRYANRTVKIIIRTYFLYAPTKVFLTVGSVFFTIAIPFAVMFVFNKITTGTYSGYYFAAGIASLFVVVALICFAAAANSLVSNNILKRQNLILSMIAEFSDSFKNQA